MQFPVFIKLHRSYRFTAFLSLFHILAACSVIVVPLPWLVRMSLLVLVGLSLWQVLRPSRIVGLSISSHDGLHCLLADDQRIPASVLADTTVFGQLIVLRLRIGNEKRASNVTLVSNHMSAKEFRILRLWLRWHTQPEPLEPEE